MNIHEYQAKAILKQFGVPVRRGMATSDLNDVENILNTFEMDTDGVVIKAQIHAGGRGKAGGVKHITSKKDALAFSAELLGKTLVTPQTKKEGQCVRTLYFEEACTIQHEYYLSLVLDREHKQIMMIASAEGGMNIEDVAQSSPEKVLYLRMHPLTGFQNFLGRRLVAFFNAHGPALSAQSQKDLMGMCQNLYKAFTSLDMEMLEINPLVLSSEGDWVALDCKMTFDDNALAQHADISALFDENEVDPYELQAKAHDLNYIKLDGNIGCMVNGAGLAMATLDIIKKHQGRPANFLDVGGGATKERVCEAFKIITADADVRVIFVNIFGGIMRCDIIAEGLIEAVKEINLQIPLVVRLQGTLSMEGRQLLNESGIAITAEDDFDRAAQTAVQRAKE